MKLFCEMHSCKTTSKLVNSAMIGLVVESSLLSKFQRDLLKDFSDFRPQAIKDLHVTLALIPQAQSHELEEALKDIAVFEPEFKTQQLVLLPGRDWDYLVFKLKPDQYFGELIELLKLSVGAQVRPDFIPHVSIMKFPHGHFEEIKERLGSKTLPNFHLVPISTGLWNSSFNMIKEVRI